MRLQDVEWVALLAVPEGYEAVLISRYYLSSMITPHDYTLLWFTLSIAYSFCGSFFSRWANIKDCDVSIYVRGKEEVLAR